VFEGSVSLYSLNYDPLLYEVNNAIDPDSRCQTGFETNNGQFSPEDFYQSQRTLAFPHGHIGFCVNESKFSEVVFDRDYTNGYKKRLFRHAFDRNMIDDICLVSGRYTSKVGSWLLDPYTTYMSKYVRDIAEASHILLLGVGMTDYHMLSFLNGRLFSEKKFIVVNFDQDTTGETKSGDILERVYRRGFQALERFILNGSWDDNEQELEKYPIEKSLRVKENVFLYHRGVGEFYKAVNGSECGRKKLLLLE